MSARLLSYLAGSSSSFLIQNQNFERWVIKPRPNRQGPYLASNEVTGAELLRRLKLPCAPWRAVRLPKSFVDECSSCESAWRLDASAPQFASRYANDLLINLQRLQNVRPTNRKWINVLLGVYVFDVWAGHVDRREFLVGACKTTSACVLIPIDNGHLFFGPVERCIDPVEGSNVLLPRATRALLTDHRYDKIIARWIHTLRRLTPSIIDDLYGPVQKSWGPNNLFLNINGFLKRLETLDILIETNRAELAM